MLGMVMGAATTRHLKLLLFGFIIPNVYEVVYFARDVKKVLGDSALE